MKQIAQSQNATLHSQTTPRQYDRDRCECRTSIGGRCRNHTAVIVQIDGREYGACKIHDRYDFVPVREVQS